MTRRILFLVDHKHRDLPSLVLIGCHLESLGFESHYVGLGNEVEVIARVDPEFIVLPKPIYDYERLLRWKIDGRRLIVIETEGNPQDLEYRLRIRVPPDLHLFWNESIAQRYRNQLERAGTVVHVVGFPRSDFLHERLDEARRRALMSAHHLPIEGVLPQPQRLLGLPAAALGALAALMNEKMAPSVGARYGHVSQFDDDGDF